MTTRPEKVPTGIKGPIIIDRQPMGALLVGRSSATMMGLFVLTGIIDADFTGELCYGTYSFSTDMNREGTEDSSISSIGAND